MIIESLEMTNFLSHEKTNIVFENGINIITGKNGAGKTSILDAIKFALFAESRNSEKNNELIKKGKHFFDIYLRFNVNGDEYEVYRHFGIKSAKNAERLAYIKKNSVIIAETYEGITQEISKILGVSREIFKNSVFVEQGQMDSLISGTPKERKQIFSDIIGLTSLSKNADKLREIINRLKAESLLLQNSKEKMDELKEDTEKLKGKNEELSEEKKLLEEMESEYQQRLMGLDKNIKTKIQYENTMKARQDEMQRNEGNIKSLEKNRETIEKDLISYSANKKILDELESNIYYTNRDIINEYFSIKRENGTLEKSLDELNKNISNYKSNLNNKNNLTEYHEKYHSAKKLYDSNSMEIKKYNSAYNEYNQKDMRLKAINEILVKKSENIKKYKGQFPDINNLREQKENIQTHIQESNSGNAFIKSQVAQLNSKMNEYRLNMETLNGKSQCPLCGETLSPEHLKKIEGEYSNNIKEIIGQIEKLKVKKAENDDNIKKYGEEYALLNSDAIEQYIADLRESKSLESEKNEISERLNLIKNDHDRYLALSDENEKMEKILREIEPYELKYTKYSHIVSEIDIDGLEKKQADLDNEIKNNNAKLGNIEKSTGIIPEESKFNNVYKISERINELKKGQEIAIGLREKLANIDEQINNLNKSIEALGNEIESYKTRLSEFDGMEQEYEKLKEEMDQKRQERIRKEVTINQNNETINEHDKKIKNLNNDVENYNKIADAIRKLDKIRESYDVNGIQSMIRKDASVSITNMARKYLTSFNLDFDDISIDENFDIKVTQNSMEQFIESLSGGEKTALAIALRLSVANYVLDRISAIIMDEPTNFLDEDRRNNLKDIIQYSLKGENIIPQMIMITHHSELTSVADISYEVIKTDGSSRVISI